MALGKWISNLKGLFEEGPMKELTEHVADDQQLKLSAEQVVITDEFRNTFNVNSPVRENIRNSFLFSMLTMASHIVIADGKVEPEEYEFLGKFLNDTFGEEAKVEGLDVVKKLIAKHDELEAKKPMAFLQLIGDCGSQIANSLSEDLRYQMLSMLGMKATDVDALMNLDAAKAKDEWQWIKEK